MCINLSKQHLYVKTKVFMTLNSVSVLVVAMGQGATSATKIRTGSSSPEGSNGELLRYARTLVCVYVVVVDG